MMLKTLVRQRVSYLEDIDIRLCATNIHDANLVRRARARVTIATTRDLQGKVAVVTGRAGGIGRVMGRRFGLEGMKVVLADVLAEPLDEATRALADEGEPLAPEEIPTGHLSDGARSPREVARHVRWFGTPHRPPNSGKPPAPTSRSTIRSLRAGERVAPPLVVAASSIRQPLGQSPCQLRQAAVTVADLRGAGPGVGCVAVEPAPPNARGDGGQPEQ